MDSSDGKRPAEDFYPYYTPSTEGDLSGVTVTYEDRVKGDMSRLYKRPMSGIPLEGTYTQGAITPMMDGCGLNIRIIKLTRWQRFKVAMKYFASGFLIPLAFMFAVIFAAAFKYLLSGGI